MPLNNKQIKKILKDYKKEFEILVKYDETREWPLGRTRIDITINNAVLKKLRECREKTGKPISQIIEDAIRKSN